MWVKGTHRFLSTQLGVMRMQLFQSLEMAVEVSLVLNQRLEVQDSDEFLSGTKPEQINPEDRLVVLVSGVRN